MKENMKLKQIMWNANKYRNRYQQLSLKLKLISKSKSIYFNFEDQTKH